MLTTCTDGPENRCCAGDSIIAGCANTQPGVPMILSCLAEVPNYSKCGWHSSSSGSGGGYSCSTTTASDPSGAHPRLCPDLPPKCGQQGKWIECVYDASTQTCLSQETMRKQACH